VLAAFVTGVAVGQSSVPYDDQSVEQTLLATIDIAKAVDHQEDRELRLSRVTIAPHGHIGLRSRLKSRSRRAKRLLNELSEIAFYETILGCDIAYLVAPKTTLVPAAQSDRTHLPGYLSLVEGAPFDAL
jgi:hypothetical protein